jgi:cardiolipin synthase (CMP-forming)
VPESLRIGLPWVKIRSRRLNPLRSAPNLLTLMRMCLAPFLVAAILEGHFLLSFILFIAAGLTDALDGLLARVLKQRSCLGIILIQSPTSCC